MVETPNGHSGIDATCDLADVRRAREEEHEEEEEEG